MEASVSVNPPVHSGLQQARSSRRSNLGRSWWYFITLLSGSCYPPSNCGQWVPDADTPLVISGLWPSDLGAPDDFFSNGCQFVCRSLGVSPGSCEVRDAGTLVCRPPFPSLDFHVEEFA